MSTKTILVIGGGIFGIASANHLRRDLGEQYKIKLVSPSDYAYFLPAAIRLPFSKDYENTVIPLTQIVDKGIEIIKDEVTFFDEKSVTTKSGKTIDFDVLILATGSKWPNPVASTAQFGDDYKKHFDEEGEKIKHAKSILLIGGGFVNAELAGEILENYEEEFEAGTKKLTVIHNLEKLLPNNGFYGDSLRDNLVKWFSNKAGVKLYLNSTATQAVDNPQKWVVNGNEEIEADLVYFGTGAKAVVPENKIEGFLNERGFIYTKRTFQAKAVSQGHIFAIGDINDFPYRGLLKLEPWVKTITSNVKTFLEQGPQGKLKDAPTYTEGENIPAAISLGSKDGLGQAPLPIIGTMTAFPRFVITGLKSKKLLTNKSIDMFTK